LTRVNASGGLLIAQAVSHDAGHQIHDEVGDRTVAGVLDLTQVFQFVEDGFDQSPPAQDGFFEVSARHGFHVFPERRDELDPLLG
jgi:hypothetical protein